MHIDMTKEIVSSNRPSKSDDSNSKSELSVGQAQQIIFNFLLEIVNHYPPQTVLEEFSRLFVDHGDSISSDAIPALHIILFSNNEQEFRNTLKRCCYILVNNWEVARQFDAIQDLVKLFDNPALRRKTFSPTLKRLRYWVNNFIESSDFRELSLFAARFAEDKTLNRPGEWSSQYSSYLLISQAINPENPIEQREAARNLAGRLKDQFKIDLAMYTAHSQSAIRTNRSAKNPTALGDEALRLIKAIVARRGEYSYKNLSRIFLEQTQDLSYANFKRNLPEYLFFTVKNYPLTHELKRQLQRRLDTLYVEHNRNPVDASIILRTCNRAIDYLMTEDRKSPSDLFVLMLSRGNSLTLAIILLKLILISRGSLLYLEARIADLISYYEQFPRDQCYWIINFLEVFRVTFAIYAENVEYNLVKVVPENSQEPSKMDWETFRIYSQTIGSTDDLSEDQGQPL